MRNIREDSQALKELRDLVLDFVVKNNIEIPLRIEPELGVGLLGLVVCKDFLLGLLLNPANKKITLANFTEIEPSGLEILINKRKLAFLEFDGVEIAFYYLDANATTNIPQEFMAV